MTLPVTLTTSVAGLVVADVNGDNKSDIVQPVSSSAYRVSYGASTSFSTLAATNLGATRVVGKFDGNAGADLLGFLSLSGPQYMYLSPRLGGTSTKYSREEMH
jgi:hypothetical protein